MAKNTRLELTWIGMDERPRLEPRILIEDPGLSYTASAKGENDIFDNLLIYGDNLLALKALEADYSGIVKCIYIDPPFNTQQAMPNYEDGIEHSIWLTLIRDRLEILNRLLHDEGTMFIHIDDNELAYLTVLCDEIFGRKNRVSIVTFKQGAATGHKSINPGVVSTSNFVLIYAKDKTQWKPNRIFAAVENRDKRYAQFIENKDEDFKHWRFRTLGTAFALHLGLEQKQVKKVLGEKHEETLTNFVYDNAERVIRFAQPDYDAVGAAARVQIDISAKSPKKIFRLERGPNLSDMYFVAGQRILFYSDKLKFVDGKYVPGEPVTSIWDDILSNNLHNEGGVEFPKGKKPEGLIKRCLDLATQRGDFVLDSFAGSGTTGAVAHKMGRRWIMVELGEHAVTHIVPRLKRVVDAEDRSGVTEATGWQGGGGFRFYRLAPSLLSTDKWGNWVIAKTYNAAMLAEAICKLMGFVYAPSQDKAEYWRHGHSSERDFIYVTTASLTHDQLRSISEDVGPDRSLLICCKAFNARAAEFENLTVKKIPQAVLSRCEWGKDDYSLRIAALPEREETVSPPMEPAPPSAQRKRKGRDDQPGFFDNGEV